VLKSIKLYKIKLKRLVEQNVQQEVKENLFSSNCILARSSVANAS